MTATLGTASSFVSLATASSVRVRPEIPHAANTIAAISSAAPRTVPTDLVPVVTRLVRAGAIKRSAASKLFDSVASGFTSRTGLVFGISSLCPCSVQPGKHARNEKECGDRRQRQAADDRTTEWCVLLAAFAHPERHRHHADDHREGRHQHRAETCETGFNGCFHRVLTAR